MNYLHVADHGLEKSSKRAALLLHNSLHFPEGEPGARKVDHRPAPANDSFNGAGRRQFRATDAIKGDRVIRGPSIGGNSK